MPTLEQGYAQATAWIGITRYGVVFADTFPRTVSPDGWGDPDLNLTHSTYSIGYNRNCTVSVNGSEGIVETIVGSNSGGVDMVFGAGFADFDLYFELYYDYNASFYPSHYFVFRSNEDWNTGPYFNFDNAVVPLFIYLNENDGTDGVTGAVSGVNFFNRTSFRVHLSGTTFSVKVWDTANTEPGGWTVTTAALTGDVNVTKGVLFEPWFNSVSGTMAAHFDNILMEAQYPFPYNQSYAQAGAIILSTYQGFAQAQTSLNQSQYVAQANAKIFGELPEAHAQATAWIALQRYTAVFRDTFNRVTTAPPFAVGNADTGQPWVWNNYDSNVSGAASSPLYSDGTALVLPITTGQTYDSLHNTGATTGENAGEFYMDVWIPATGDNGAYTRWYDKNWYFRATNIETVYRIDGLNNSATFPITTRSAWYRIHVAVDPADVSNRAKVRFWKVGDTEPSTWTTIQTSWPADNLSPSYVAGLLDIYETNLTEPSKFTNFTVFAVGPFLYNQGYAGAMAQIMVVSQGFAQSGAILNQSMHAAQTNTDILVYDSPQFGQSQAFIKKSKGLAQAQAAVRIPPGDPGTFRYRAYADGAVVYYGMDSNPNTNFTIPNDLGTGNDLSVSYPYSNNSFAGYVVPAKTAAQWYSNSYGFNPSGNPPVTGQTNWSAEFWIKPNLNNVSMVVPVWTLYGYNAGYYRLNIYYGNPVTTAGSISSGTHIFVQDTTPSVATVHDAGSYVSNVWHHIVLTSSSGFRTLYVDGVLQSSWSSADGPWTNEYMNYDGYTGSRSTYEQYRDDWALYNVTLTSDQVSAHYYSGDPTRWGFSQVLASINTASHVAQASWYIFNSTPGATNTWQGFAQASADILVSNKKSAQAQSKIILSGLQKYAQAQAALNPYRAPVTNMGLWVNQDGVTYLVNYPGWPNFVSPTMPNNSTWYAYGTFIADMTGTWQFQMIADFESRLYIDGATIMDVAYNSGTVAQNVSLTAGDFHTITLWWTGDSAINGWQVWYKRPDDTYWNLLTSANPPWHPFYPGLTQPAQAMAYLWSYGYPQVAQAQVYVGHFKSGNAQADIKQTYPVGFGQALAHIWNKQGFAQTQALIIPRNGLLAGIGYPIPFNYAEGPYLPDKWYSETGPAKPNYDNGGAGYPPGWATNDSWSMRWYGRFTADLTGAWGFQSSTDDGSRVDIYDSTNTLVGTFDNNLFGGQGETTRSGTISLVKGHEYLLVARAIQGGGGWAFRFWFHRPGESTWNFLTDNNAPWVVGTYNPGHQAQAQARITDARDQNHFAQANAYIGHLFYAQAQARIIGFDVPRFGQAQALVASPYGFLLSGNPTSYEFDNFATSWDGLPTGWPNYPTSNYYDFGAVARFTADTTGTWLFRILADDRGTISFSNTVVATAYRTGSYQNGSIALVSGQEYNISVTFTESDLNTEYISAQYQRPGDPTWYYLTDNKAPWALKVKGLGSAQANAQILPTPHTSCYAQAQARIFGHPWVNAQATADIKQTNRQYAQALAFIGHIQIANAAARILQTYTKSAQALAWIGHFKSANAQAWIKVYGKVATGQAQTLLIKYTTGLASYSIKQTYPFESIDVNYAMPGISTAVASTTFSGTASNVIDGDPTTYWMTMVVEGQWIQVTFDTWRTIDSFRIVSHTFDPTVQVYLHTISGWVLVDTLQLKPDATFSYENHMATPVATDAIQLYVLNMNAGDGIQISTIEAGLGSLKGSTLAQAQAFLGHLRLAQSQVYISPGVGTQGGQALTDVVVTNWASAQANAWVIPPTSVANAHSWIFATSNGYANVSMFIIPPTWTGNAQARMIAIGINATSQAKADIRVMASRSAQARAVILQKGGYAQAVAHVIGFRGKSYAMANAYIGHLKAAQAQARIVKSPQLAQAQTAILVHNNVYTGYARASIIRRLGFAQAKYTVLTAYKVSASALSLIDDRFALAQAGFDIVKTYTASAQVNIDVWNYSTRFSKPYGQAQAVVHIRYYDSAQANAWVSRRYQPTALAAAQIGFFKYAQANARVIAFNVPQTGNASGYILSSSSIVVPGPTSDYQTYLVSYNGYKLPGYAQSEEFTQTQTVKEYMAAHTYAEIADTTGWADTTISLTMRLWEPTYAQSKRRIQEAAAYLRSHRSGYKRLYIQRYDRYYLAIPIKITVQKDVSGSMRTLDYTIEFTVHPEMVDN